MKFTELDIAGCFLVELQPHSDERGNFARTYCRDEFAANRLNPCVAQCNVSFNAKRHTLRGMHYQAAPNAEAKLVRCTAGAVFDVVLDLRPASPHYLKWQGIELSAKARNAVYLAEGCAHGFLTLVDETEVFYQMSAPYVADAARGVRFDDPAFGIVWPVDDLIVSTRDRQHAEWVGE